MEERKYRILVFSPIFAPFANPEAIVNNKLVLAFLDAGWHVDVISRKVPKMYGYNYGSEWVEPWLQLKKITHEVDYKVGGRFRQYLEAVRDSLKTGYLIEGCRWAAHALDSAVNLHKLGRYDIVLSRALPDAGHLAALTFVQQTGVPWIANWNDPVGDKNPPPAGKGAEARLNYFNEKLLKGIARRASWFTFPSERMRQYICRYLKNGSENRSSTIPHIALKPQRYAPQKMQNDHFTICYAGHLYSGRDPNPFLGAVAKFISRKKCHATFKLIIIGLEDIGLSALLEKYDLKANTLVTGPLSYLDTLKMCSSSDVLLVIEAPYPEGIYLPSKFVDYVQTGRPILAISPEKGTMGDIISTYGGGIAADCASSGKIANALEELYSQWEGGTLEMNYGSDRLYALFSPKTIIAKYKELFSLLGVEK